MRELEILDRLRESAGITSGLAQDWFLEKTHPVTRGTFEARGKLGDKGTGSVYAYFDNNGAALYVGLTSRKVKARLHDQTSPHKKKAWWPMWVTMRFVPLTDDMDRQILEFLLILAYKPQFNEKPKATDLENLLLS